MPSYRDLLLASLMQQQAFPDGAGGEEQYVGQNARRGASMQASLGEDAMLINQLGRSKRKRRNEPTGHYSAVDYAGGPSAWMAAHGVEKGFRYTQPGEVMSNKEKMALAEKGDKWYDHQMKLWGRSPGMQPKSYDQLRTANRAWRNR